MWTEGERGREEARRDGKKEGRKEAGKAGGRDGTKEGLSKKLLIYWGFSSPVAHHPVESRLGDEMVQRGRPTSTRGAEPERAPSAPM